MNKRISSFFRVDEQVFFTMAGVCLLSLIVLAFRYAADSPCAPVTIEFNAASFTEGSPVRIKAKTDKGSAFSWDFGDGQASDDYTPNTTHIYKKAGKYTVTLVVDGKCPDIQNIIIAESPIVVNTSFLPLIIGPDTAYVNEPVNFADASPTSKSWEWRFGETQTVDAYDNAPQYTYTTAGIKRVTLKVNGRADLVVQKWMNVIDKDAQKNRAALQKAEEDLRRRSRGGGGGGGGVVVVPSDPSVAPLSNPTVVDQPVKKEEPKAPIATKDMLESMLMGVVDGSKRADDFSEYLCGNLSRQVVYNGNTIAFNKLCEELKTIKKKKIAKLSVVPMRNAQTNCLESMTVTLEKKKGFLGL